VLSVRLTDERDPFFLFHASVSEDDFAALKAEQGLLVDFADFPARLVQLLGLCGASAVASDEDAHGKFVLVLRSAGSQPAGALRPATATAPASPPTLNLVETNSFKHLVHLTLRLVPSNDEELKSYLASCLRTLREQVADLSTRLQHSTQSSAAEITRLRQSSSDSERTLERMQSEHAAQLAQLRADHSVAVSTMRDSANQERAQAAAAWEQERAALHARSEEQQRTLALQLSQAQLAIQRLTAERNTSEERLQAQSARAEELQAQLVNIKAQNERLQASGAEQEKQLGDLKIAAAQTSVRIAALSQELSDKEQVCCDSCSRC
jgi:spindle assembly abnormal protein 6